MYFVLNFSSYFVYLLENYYSLFFGFINTNTPLTVCLHNSQLKYS